MKKLVIAAGAAALLAASSFAALADEASGTIASIDNASGSVTLNDGKVYFLPQTVAATNLKVGDKVTITFSADSTGKMMASDLKPSA
jgi:Cu/Ag efflux protein CusF